MSLKNYEIWFVTGSQHLYGPKVLEQVASNSQEIAEHLNAADNVPVSVQFKPIVKTASEISALCAEANNAENCIGIITWMHTFSPLENVDQRSFKPSKTFPSPSHAIRHRDSLGRNRHELYEP